jgi:hypothetical protein
MKKHASLLVLIILAAGIVAALVASLSKDPAVLEATRKAPPPSAVSAERPATADPYRTRGKSVSVDHNRAPAGPFPEVPKSRAGIAISDDPFDGRSKAEQRWLDAHGYPNTLQWEAYNMASDGLLEQAAESGDTTAQTLLDARLLPDKAALDRLMLSVVDGNVFALQMIASHYASTGKNGNVNAYAASRVLEMRGDPSAAVGREIMFRPPLELDERMRGEAEALHLNATLNRIYQEKYGAPFTPDLRPFPIENPGN